MFVRPQRDAVEGVDVSVAVGSEDRHVAGGFEQGDLQVDVTRFGETRGVTHRAARTHRAQLGDGVDREVAIDGDECGVRDSRQVCERGEARNSVHVGLLRMDRPNLARVAELLALSHDGRRRRPADDGDAAGVHESCEVDHG